MASRPLLFLLLALAAAAAGCAGSQAATQAAHTPVASPTAQDRADAFLGWYSAVLQSLFAQTTEAFWDAATDVSEENTGRRIGADQVYSAFTGHPHVIETARALLTEADALDEGSVRQLRVVLLKAAEAPGTHPELVSRRIELEARQSAALDGFQLCLARDDEGACAEPVSANDIDRVLVESRDLGERQRVWEASKEIGAPLRDGILALRDVRNGVAQALGHEDFMALQVADYGMSRAEMVRLMDSVVEQTRPLYTQLHCWAKRTLAERYGVAEVPRRIPAHWLPNRWGQSWPGLVEAADMDALFEGRDPAWIVQQGEAFYVSMGFPELPQAFWDGSDLYPVPEGEERRKNSHASAWHMDLGQDVRSLMSVEANARWFGTTHHELGHIYYFLAYSHDEVPVLLREGANRAFHEAIGSQIELVTLQPAYLRQVEVWPADREVDATQVLLDQALGELVFLPFAAGTMTHFESDLYAGGLTGAQLNEAWWGHAGRFQGIAPPTPRDDPSLCDACTKTHINDDPGQYYDYAVSNLILHQLHAHICREILDVDPHECSYFGQEAVGEYLRGVLSIGATRDWREVMREATGAELSAEALLAYYAPLMAYLSAQNEGRDCAFD